MKKKILVFICCAVLISGALCACSKKQEGDSAASTNRTQEEIAEATPENGNEVDITEANFSIETVKEGDSVSNFTVKSVEKTTDSVGNVISCSVSFEGTVTVSGEYSVDSESGVCMFNYTEEYSSFLPFSKEFEKENNVILLDGVKSAENFVEESGTAAIEIYNYVFEYSEESGVAERVTDFSMAESEYAIIGY